MNFIRKTLGKRHQLFEIQDYEWCPDDIRNGITDYLGWTLKILRIYHPAIPWILKMSEASGRKWVDLCAGAAGGSLPLLQKLPELNLTITDLYPNSSPKNIPNVIFYQNSVDARNVPDDLEGLRTLFTSFHHLNDKVAHSVLEDAFKKNKPIGVFEFTQRDIFSLLMTAPNILLSFIFMPFVWPWKFSRFFWTYFIPFIPIFSTIDILMTCLRTRSIQDLEIMVQDLKDENYKWHIGQESTTLGFKITYLVGLPKKSL